MLATPTEELRSRVEALAGCVTGAASVPDVQAMLASAGFERVRVDVKPESRAFIAQWIPGSGAENFVASASIEAVKPGGAKACCGPACCEPEA